MLHLEQVRLHGGAAMQLDARAGQARKFDGMQIALNFSGDWPERVLSEFKAWAAVQRARGLRTVTIEQFRAETRCAPESHKAWGSLPRLALKAGVITENLGEDGLPRYQRAAAPKTHAHPVRVWGLA